MSKIITRAQLRGEPLMVGFCNRAKTTTHEYGRQDNRVFCHGFIDCMTDELCETCAECKAHVRNAEPIEEANDERL